MKAFYHSPAPQLAPYIHHYFVYAMDRATVRQVFPRGMHILPTAHGKMGIFFGTPTVKRMSGRAETQNPQIGFSGFYNRPVYYHTDFAASMIIVTFTPVGLQQMLQFSLAEISNCNLDVRDASAGDHDFLCNEMFSTEDWSSRIRMLDEFFFHKFREVEFPERAAHIAGYIMKTGGDKPIKSICSELGIGERTLQRTFLNGLGVTPKAFSKLVRFQRAVKVMAGAPGRSLTDISYSLGYFDQAHFIREFKSLYGASPRVFIRRRQSEAGMALEAHKSSLAVPATVS